MKKKILIVTLLFTTLLSACTGGSDTRQTQEGTSSISTEGNEAATTAASTSETTEESEAPYILTFDALTVDGDSFTSDCFADSKLTMINVWATYCSPCLNEMPDLGEIAASYDPAEFQIIGIVCDVSTDSDAEDIAYAKSLIEQTGANYTHLLLSESLYSNLVGAVDAVPTTFFVNQSGEVLGYLVGSCSKEDWEDLIHELLAEINQ